MNPAPDIRLIAVDMDGTLLDSTGQMPAGLASVLAQLQDRGICFCPASGRQFQRLHSQFAPFGDVAADLVYLAENGAHAVGGDEPLFSATMDPDDARAVIHTARRLAASQPGINIVMSTIEAAYLESDSPAFVAEAASYYASRRQVSDLTDHVDAGVLKIAIHDVGDAEAHVAPTMDDFAATRPLQAALSGAHWVDVLIEGVNKGTALDRIQQHLGITRAQTMVFGDYLNDLELIGAADWSYAMANAHPDILAAARHRAPSNDDSGVLQTIEDVLGIAP